MEKEKDVNDTIKYWKMGIFNKIIYFIFGKAFG
jgi:hypothetical protein